MSPEESTPRQACKMTKTAISVFDLDHTLLKVNCSYYFGTYLYKRKIIASGTLIYLLTCYSLHKLNIISMKTLQHHTFKVFFQGKSKIEFQQYVKDFLDIAFDQMLYLPAVEKLRCAQAEGHHTAILSSSPDFLVEIIAHRFGVDEWSATKYKVDQNHRFLSITSVMQGADKAKYLQAMSQCLNIPKEMTTAYSDSHLDFKFLEAAGNAVAVNPNRVLRYKNRKKKWHTL